RPLRPFRVIAQELAVLLERRTAAGRVDHDGAEVVAFKDGDIVASAGARHFELAAVGVERAAAALVGRCYDVVSSAVEKSHAGRVGFAEQYAHDASADESGSPAVGTAYPGRCFRQ